MISITEFFRKKQICRGTTGAPGKPADGGNKKKTLWYDARPPCGWRDGRAACRLVRWSRTKQNEPGCHSMRSSRITGWGQGVAACILRASAGAGNRTAKGRRLLRVSDAAKVPLGVTLSDNAPRASVKSDTASAFLRRRRPQASENSPFFCNFAPLIHRLHYTIRFT